MEFKDYYETLGVKRDASPDQIKRAYRKLARKYHPDVSSDSQAEARFKEVGEAYEVLKDPEKRAAYDRLGSRWKTGQEFRPPPDWSTAFDFGGGGYTEADAAQFSDFFEMLFGAGARGPRATRRSVSMRGEDQHARIVIDLADAYRGAMRTLSLSTPEITPEGRVSARERTLNVRVPKGVKQGQQIRLAGQGAPGMNGGEPGDLYLQVEFSAVGLYRVDGADVYLDLPVAPWEAALGASIKIPTPSGAVNFKVPPSSYQGRKLRLKERGIPAKTPGDLYVVLQVTLPPADSDEAREAYEQMKKLNFNPRAGMGV